jgi:mRNA interferase HigB
MRIIGKMVLVKLKKKNIGNSQLCDAIDKLLNDLETLNPQKKGLKEIRKDADSVHPEGFYFFDIDLYRTLLLIETEDEGEATIIWAGSHQEYIRTFKNNRATIEKWLRNRDFIE